VAAASSKSTEGLLRLIPRTLEPRVGQLRRDLRSVLAGLRGERAPAWLARDGARYVDTRRPNLVGLATRELEVAACTRETDDAITLTFRDPNRDPNAAPMPAVRPGQFFTLLIDLDGVSLRRAYSVSSDCRTRERFDVTIKRVEGGRVSSHLHAHAAVGMRMRVLGPSGEFARVRAPKLVLIAGGSGITPMMALLRTLLPSEPGLEVALIYANRSRKDVIFAEPLAALEAEHRPRLRIHHVLEQPPSQWSGAVGRCDKPTLARLLDAIALAHDPDAEFLLCGPAPMMAGARELLHEREVPAGRVHSESFIAPYLRADAQAQLHRQPLTIVADGRETELVVAPGHTVLEAGLAAGLALPYSCAMGGCGACKLELERGEVIMREPNCLTERERERNMVLACISNPLQPCRLRVPTGEGGDGAQL
jgi:ring-1,2-phenylacetyl-CoA epoxidase subunit PaaE